MLATFATAEEHKAHWSYDGAEGPAHWAELGSENHLCKDGKEQSPIDLKWKKPKPVRDIQFLYHPGKVSVVNNGHTIQVNFPKGSQIEISSQKFELLQMHFHALSEHTLSGKHFPLEAHFVHKDAQGHLAVVGVFYKVGKANPMIDKIWSEVPHKSGQELALKSEVNPEDFLPKTKTHYHYMGSLTTPPCSEGVNWNVMNTPLELSAEQLKSFTMLYSDNYRPVQQTHNRSIANYAD